MTSDISTLEPNTPDRVNRRRRRWWWLPSSIAAILIASVLIVVALPRLLKNPRTVDRIAFVNPTRFATDVDVTGARRDGWMGLGTAERQATTVVRDVIDQGDTWIFRFESQGFEGGELRMTKAELARSGWRVVIPDAMGERLAGQGAAPTPPSHY